MSERIGLLVGRENTFPQPFLDAVNEKGRGEGIQAEMAVLGGAAEMEEPGDAVSVDPIWHGVRFYRAALMSAVLVCAAVVRDPVEWDDYVRCLCIGRTHGLPIRYDPRRPCHERYRIQETVEGELREHAIRDAQTLTQALGYDMDTVEFAVRDGILYAIDFLNPAPDFDNFSIKEDNFSWVLDRMSDLVLKYARGEAKPPWRGEHRWWRYVTE